RARCSRAPASGLCSALDRWPLLTAERPRQVLVNAGFGPATTCRANGEKRLGWPGNGPIRHIRRGRRPQGNRPEPRSTPGFAQRKRAWRLSRPLVLVEPAGTALAGRARACKRGPGLVRSPGASRVYALVVRAARRMRRETPRSPSVPDADASPAAVRSNAKGPPLRVSPSRLMVEPAGIEPASASPLRPVLHA